MRSFAAAKKWAFVQIFNTVERHVHLQFACQSNVKNKWMTWTDEFLWLFFLQVNTVKNVSFSAHIYHVRIIWSKLGGKNKLLYVQGCQLSVCRVHFCSIHESSTKWQTLSLFLKVTFNTFLQKDEALTFPKEYCWYRPGKYRALHTSLIVTIHPWRWTCNIVHVREKNKN